jgi:hypothetical protein
MSREHRPTGDAAMRRGAPMQNTKLSHRLCSRVSQKVAVRGEVVADELGVRGLTVLLV